MTTHNQLLRYGRKAKPYYCKRSHLRGCPQKSGVVEEIRIMAPKKPNSAKRKVTKVTLCTGRSLIAHIPGSGYNLQKHSDVLVRSCRRRDLPGVHYSVIRGKLDFTTTQKFDRHNRRSKFGLKRKFRPIDEGPIVETLEDKIAVEIARFEMAARMVRNRLFAQKSQVTFSHAVEEEIKPIYSDDLGDIYEEDVKKWEAEQTKKAALALAEAAAALENKSENNAENK